MARNVEIKARVDNLQEMIALTRKVSGESGEVIKQVDVFFNCENGRLKLRIFTSGMGDLIYYQRPDQSGPKTSTYSISKTTEPEKLQSVLEQSLGVRAIVRKTRHLYMVGRTRIHLDSVEDLGDFIELEVVLGHSEKVSDGKREAENLMTILNIDRTSLIDSAYIDLLTTQEE